MDGRIPRKQVVIQKPPTKTTNGKRIPPRNVVMRR